MFNNKTNSYICSFTERMYNSISSLIQHATSQGYRSNVVKPLTGMAIVLLIATVVLFYFKVIIFGYIIGSLAVVLILAFLFSYFFCLVKNPDLLRSEKYNLEKTAMEKVAITGDSTNRHSIAMPQSDFVIVEGNQERENVTDTDSNE